MPIMQVLRRGCLAVLPLALVAGRTDQPRSRGGEGGGTLAGRPTESLSWMAGCWEHRAGRRVVEEQWLAPRGGILLGVGRTTRSDTLVEYEFVRIYEAGDTLIYAAAPSGQKPAEFRATSWGPTVVTFENPSHDFPQRVQYRRAGADSLVARVEGQRGGGAVRAIQFPYRRVSCPAGR